jgi:LEA14-like dessication related protein
MKNPLLHFVFIALCWFGLAGCASHGTLGGVAVTIVEIKPAAAAVPDAQAVLALRFANENVAAVGMASSTHKLYLNGSYVGKAVNATPEGLPAMTPTTLNIPVKFENPTLVGQLAGAAGAKTTSYRLESDVLVVVGEDNIHVTSNEQGTVDLSPLAAAR